MESVTDEPLPALRARPVRFYSLAATGGYLAEFVLHLREWVHSEDADEPPLESFYAVQELGREDHGWLGRVFLLLRLNELPTKAPLYDDAEAEEGRVFCVRVPPIYGDSRTPGDCDCKGYRTFVRCSHLDAMSRAARHKPAAQKSDSENSPTEEYPAELESWLTGADTP